MFKPKYSIIIDVWDETTEIAFILDAIRKLNIKKFYTTIHGVAVKQYHMRVSNDQLLCIAYNAQYWDSLEIYLDCNGATIRLSTTTIIA